MPSMKNQKMLTRGRLITKPERQKWMERCIQSLVSQFVSYSRTIEDGTLTEQQRLSLTASLLPADDSRQWLKEITIVCSEVFKGGEGAVVVVERIQ